MRCVHTRERRLVQSTYIGFRGCPSIIVSLTRQYLILDLPISTNHGIGISHLCNLLVAFNRVCDDNSHVETKRVIPGHLPRLMAGRAEAAGRAEVNEPS